MRQSASAFRRHLLSAFPWASIVALIVFFGASVANGEDVLQQLEIVTSSGAHMFHVEIADTPSARAKGLMHRRAMPQDQGMLFNFKMDTPVTMWMKNTYIPLDMVFVSRYGIVTNVAADAKPMSEAIISSDGPAYAVIELNAGVASGIGLKVGDEVRHPAFKR
jgi:uncharacterized membrane protein (UPF0127 family)